MFAKWAHARPLLHASRKLLYSQGCRRCAQRASPHEESGSVREQGGFVDLSQRVEARQELRLTTELRQGIEIMQMSAVELSDYVKQRVEENPFLDDDDWLYPQHPYEADTYTRTVSTDELVREHFAPATTVEEFREGVAKQFGLPDMAKEDPQFPDLVLGELAKRLVEDPDPADRMDGMPDDALRIMCAIDALAAHLDLDLTDEQVIAQMPGDDAEQREKIFKQLKDQGLEAEGRKFALREAALGWLVNNSRVSFK